MKRSHFPILMVAATLVACSDRQAPTDPASHAIPAPAPAPINITLFGKVVANVDQFLPSTISLLQWDGTTVSLAGEQTAWLASVLDADVEVYGQLGSVGEVNVDRFVVLAVKGSSVSDGILQAEDDVYSLALTNGGRRDLMDPPEEMKAHVGERMWIIAEEGMPAEFGLITDATKLAVARFRRF